MKDATDRIILKTAHKAAKALHRVGALDDLTMREMDTLCLPPLKIGGFFRCPACNESAVGVVSKSGRMALFDGGENEP